ncbi:HNH endonuclease family protein [Mycobacterium sp. NPDC048908]|uniref:HNH endonuclease family protein n=1 Tax=Mycobacterium sp. NPDC048908 TaxID=3364292 RepID=UPI00371A2535
MLKAIPVVAKLPQVPGYERSCSPGKGCVFGAAWNDPADTSGCDTRNRVLAAQLTDVVFKPGTRNCKVVSGILHDPYTGVTLVFDNATRADIEIDHVFALAAAWDAGAAQWPYERRVEFANDTDNLLAVSGEENQHKSDSGPGNWLPPNQEFTCRYIERYLSMAAKYQLMVAEQDKTVAQSACPG